MQYRDVSFPSAEPACEVHQTTDVSANEYRCAGRNDVLDLPVHHRRRNLGEFQREDSPETAARFGFWQIHDVEPSDVIEQDGRLLAHPEASQSVA